MKSTNRIVVGSKSRYAAAMAMTFFALASEDQNGMAVSPDAFVEVGKPPPSRMLQTKPVLNTSDTKASAFIADMLIALIEHQSSMSATSASLERQQITGKSGIGDIDIGALIASLGSHV